MDCPGVTFLFVVGLSGFPRRIFVLSKAVCGGAFPGFPGVTLLFVVGLSEFARRHTLQMFDASLSCQRLGAFPGFPGVTLLFVVGLSGFPRCHTLQMFDASLSCQRLFVVGHSRVFQASHFSLL